MKSKPRPKRLVIGAMTGTSLDGIDVATAMIQGQGLDMRAKLLRHVTAELGPLRDELHRAAQQEPMTARQFAGLALALGKRYADTIADAAEPGQPSDLIAVHGQTIVHRPPVSWQLINPAPIAARFDCPVVYNLRQADIAAGGQGAPITPIADWILFRDRLHRRAIVNLGGFCNATILPAARSGKPLEQVRGFDICACNLVLDAVARQTLGTPYDQGGGAAQCGAPHAKAVQDLCATFRRQRSEHRSLGTEDEASDWVAQHKIQLPPNDLAASAVVAVAECIGEAIAEHNVDQIIIAGGGAHNRALVDAIDRQCHTPARLSDALGVPIQAREALAMAVLGALCADGIPITLPQVTGCTEPAPVAGTWCLPTGLRSQHPNDPAGG
ncbi:MAG: anhydro-N-acetylmuramic acid kinase [Planctomycetota bacterium]|nr:anhydro-N-acetylmuramic acid kinase [Planctomycetota bacterium]